MARLHAALFLALTSILCTVVPLVLACAGPKPAPEQPKAPPPPPVPLLPIEPYKYADADNPYPRHFTTPSRRGGAVADMDNTPESNPITNHGATLGRVLFYDNRLSANDTIACASCHQQAHGFSDPNRLSTGFLGGKTNRQSMGLSNARYYRRGFYFWDERANTLEEQVLMPIQDPVEMGMSLDVLEKKLAAVDFYPPLFTAAFGTPEITRDRIAKALAQFVRSLVSYRSKYDRAFETPKNGRPDFKGTFTELEMMGLELFMIQPNATYTSLCCGNCHTTHAHVSVNAHNNGLDLFTETDKGAGEGRFKSPSLRNVMVRKHFMHDGRFATIEEVLEFYSTGIHAHADLDRRLRNPDGSPRNMMLSRKERDALIAFLHTLTDEDFLNDTRFSDPFAPSPSPAP